MEKAYQAHEFAKRAGVTVRALHHYDRLGLFKPSGRTEKGYRLYTDSDLVRLEQIVALKFIGFPLNQIRELLSDKDVDLAETLRRQREIIAAKREHLDRAVRAIERAEQVVRSGDTSDWEPFRKIIEVIQMQTRKDWMRKYYTDEQLAEIKKRWTPEVQEESTRAWAELIRDTEQAIAAGERPDGEVGRRLGARRRELIRQFTGGDPGIEESLQRLYDDKANWPGDFKKPYSEEVGAFLCEAGKVVKK